MADRSCKAVVATRTIAYAFDYFINMRSVIRVSTALSFSANAPSDPEVPMSIVGSTVTVTVENGFGTANPSHELNRQKAEYSTLRGNKGTPHFSARVSAPGPSL